MKKLRSIPKILKINEIKGYKVSCLFNNGESRIIDFENLFNEVFAIKNTHPAFPLLSDIAAFNKLTILGNSIGWEEIGITSKDDLGNEQFYHFDLDPLVLFNNSTLDIERKLSIGQLIRQERKQKGLTQEELAKKSGTTKHHISRLENDKSDIELQTLKKIIEAGLDKNLKIEIY